MNNRFFNYKFFIEESVITSGCVFSLLWLCFTSGTALMLGLLFLTICVVAFVIIFVCEPIMYVIDEKGIAISTAIKRKTYQWSDISNIVIGYDPMFKILFIKDYIIHTPKTKYVKRNERIVKCRTSTKLIIKYSNFI